MKRTLIQAALVLVACYAHGQGTLQFDQQVNPTTPPGGFGNIQPGPTGQSFIPTLSSVGFVQFYLGDPTQVQAPTLYVNLWSGSIGGGTLLGQSDPITLSTTFFGTTTFLFSTPISVTPGTTYYFQPVIQSGDSEQIGVTPGSDYLNGMAYLSGTPQPGGDLWFREGIAVPEPSSLSLAILGFIAICPVLQNRRKSKSENLALSIHSKELCSKEKPLRFCYAR